MTIPLERSQDDVIARIDLVSAMLPDQLRGNTEWVVGLRLVEVERLLPVAVVCKRVGLTSRGGVREAVVRWVEELLKTEAGMSAKSTGCHLQSIAH